MINSEKFNQLLEELANFGDLEESFESWEIDSDALAQLSTIYALGSVAIDFVSDDPIRVLKNLQPENIAKELSTAFICGFQVGYKARLLVEMEAKQ